MTYLPRIVSLYDIMNQLPVAMLLTTMRMLETAIKHPVDQWLGDLKEKAVPLFEEILTDCVDLGLDASKASAEKILKVLSKDGSTYSRFRELVAELQERMIDEMKPLRFFVMNAREAEYYNTPYKGWQEILRMFPNCFGDVEEAHKCFALARYAAAVFHILQVVEVGLIELGKLIHVNDPLPGWTATTKKLATIVSTSYPARTPFEQKNSAFFEQTHAAIHALQQAWRNKVSHAHGKLTLMTSEFHPEVAEEILMASRALMRRIATDGPWPDPSPE